MLRNVQDDDQLLILIRQCCESSALFIETIEWVLAPSQEHDPRVFLTPVATRYLRCQFKRPITCSERGLLKVICAQYDAIRDALMALDELAHEVGNPLAVLDGQLQFIYNGDVSQERWNSVFRALSQIGQRVHQATGHGVFKNDSFYVGHVIQEILEDLSVETAKKNVLWELHNTEVVLLWNREVLQQILFNLMKNAVEAAETNEVIQVSLAVQDNRCDIRVRNVGHLLTQKQIQSLFTPYYSSKDDHVGIGLTLSRKLAERNGAILEYDVDQGFVLRMEDVGASNFVQHRRS